MILFCTCCLNPDLKLGFLPNIIVVKGNEADPRMRAASQRRGIQITSLSRPIKPSDFVEFDLILAMDRQNKGGLMHWPNQNYVSGLPF